jgi:hypothetical protein
MVVSVMVGLGTVELRRRWRQSAFSSLTLAKVEDKPALNLEVNLEDAEGDQITHLPPEWLQPEQENQGGSMDAAIVELAETGEICRICVQPSQRRMFATQIGNQYYSFFQSAPSREAAWEIAQQLSQAEQQVLITPVEQEYAVWVFQPQAELDLSTIS